MWRMARLLVTGPGLLVALQCFAQAPSPSEVQPPQDIEILPLTKPVCKRPGTTSPPGQVLEDCHPGQQSFIVVPCKSPGTVLPPEKDLPPCPTRPKPPPRDCSYEGKTWADGSYMVSGRICQMCTGGSWSPRNSRPPGVDPKCSTPAPPGEVSHLKIDPRYDCDANTAAPSSGFALRLRDGKCQRCTMAAWNEVQPVSCNMARLELPPPGVAVAPTLGITVFNTINSEDFDELQAFIDSIVQGNMRASDGAWLSWELLIGYENILEQFGNWDEQRAHIGKWRSAKPESAAAALVESAYWSAYAWSARGHEYAASVPEQASKTADERMARARAVLDDAKPYAAANPAWYAQMLAIAIFEGWPRAERLALFNEAVASAPLYDPIYINMAWGLAPKWGGSLDEYRRFVRAAVKKTKAAEGNILYARLYWNLARIESDKDPFTELKIPWQPMKSGFDDLVDRYPTSQSNLQNYAYFACRAGDGKTFNALLPRLDARTPGDLKGNPWRDLYTRDYCVTRFSKGTGASKRGG
jgi:hypothetical protein